MDKNTPKNIKTIKKALALLQEAQDILGAAALADPGGAGPVLDMCGQDVDRPIESLEELMESLSEHGERSPA
jgi:hypothetical protein